MQRSAHGAEIGPIVLVAHRDERKATQKIAYKPNGSWLVCGCYHNNSVSRIAREQEYNVGEEAEVIAAAGSCEQESFGG